MNHPFQRIGALLIALAMITVGCTSSDPDTAEPERSTEAVDPGEPPTVRVSEVPDHSLVAELKASADRPFAVSVALASGDHEVEIPTSPVARSHRLPIVGMRAESDYRMTISFTDPDGEALWSTQEEEFRTGSLPADLPTMEVEVPEPGAMAPGVTLFNLLDLRSAINDSSVPADRLGGTLLMVDGEGEVVWYHQDAHQISDVRQLDDGNLIFAYGDLSTREINLFGEPIREWSTILGRTDEHAVDEFGRRLVSEDAVPFEIESIHHEYNPLPNGNHLTLSTELRDIDGFSEQICTDEAPGFDGTYPLIADVVAELDPESGETVRSWNLFDYFDPRDPDVIALVCEVPAYVFPNSLYRPSEPRALDWTHANAAVVDEERNTLIISVRHLDQVLGLRWQDDEEGASGDVLWRLGPEGDLELTEGDWNYHQHAPEVQDDGSILLYDNGNQRPGVEPYSRAVQYRIDPEAGTATELWEFRTTVGDEPGYAAFVGDADRLENGNVLITDGGLFGTVAFVSAQIVEVTPDDSPAGGTVAFRLSIVGGIGWAVYRAERLATPYPS